MKTTYNPRIYPDNLLLFKYLYWKRSWDSEFFMIKISLIYKNMQIMLFCYK